MTCNVMNFTNMTLSKRSQKQKIIWICVYKIQKQAKLIYGRSQVSGYSGCGGSELEWNMKGLWGVTDDLGADLFSLWKIHPTIPCRCVCTFLWVYVIYFNEMYNIFIDQRGRIGFCLHESLGIMGKAEASEADTLGLESWLVYSVCAFLQMISSLGPWFPSLENGDNNTSCLTGYVTYVK